MAMRDYILGEVTADYSEAVISRREALRRLGLLGLSAAAAGSLLAACGGGDDGGEEGERAGAPKIAPAPTTRPAPTAVEDIAFAGPRGEVLGVFAAASKPKGAVLVIHEIFGVTDHIRSIPLRFAADAWQLLDAGERRLAAAAPFYGTPPDNADFSGSEAAVLAVYGELDTRVNGTRDAAVAALQAAGLTHEVRTFAGADHGFFNDTSARYNEVAATESYAAVLSWFGEHLT